MVHKVYLDHEESLVVMDLLDQMAKTEKQEKLGFLEDREFLVKTENRVKQLPVRRVFLEKEDRKDRREFKVRKVTLECAVKMGNTDCPEMIFKEPRANPEIPVDLVSPAILGHQECLEDLE